MEPVKSNKVMILGGGLAGLAAGLYADAPVYEAASHCGGVAASDNESGFVFDRGIHILQTKSQKLLDLFHELGIDMVERERSAYIYSHNCYTGYPFQVNTAGLPLGVRMRCVAGFLGRNRETSGNGDIKNYQEWMYKFLGKGFAETFLIPYSNKFWTVPPTEMTHEWTGNRVPKPNTWQVLRGAFWDKQTRIGTNATFRYPDGNSGYGGIASAVEQRVKEIHLNQRATRIDTRRRRVEFNNEYEVGYEVLVSTIPLPELIRICEDVPQTVRDAAARLRTNSIMVVNLGIDRLNIQNKHWVHFPEKDVSFFRISYPHNLNEGVVPDGMSSISAEVAYSPERPIDKDTIVDRVIADLIRVGAMDKDAPVVLKTTRDIPYAYCIYDMDRKQALQTVHEWLDQQDIVPTGRYGMWTYFWSDEAFLSGKKAAEKVIKRLAMSAA